MSDMTSDMIDKTTVRRSGKRRIRLGALAGLLPVPLRLASIAALAGATLFPITQISNLAGERESRETDVQQTITQGWGPAQVVESPTLAIPIHEAKGSQIFVKIAPKSLAIKATVTPERRHRGIFGATVYTVAVEMRGTFTPPRPPPPPTPPPERGTEETAKPRKAAAARKPAPPPATAQERVPDGSPELAAGVIALPVRALDGVDAGDGVRIGAAKSSWQLCADRFSVEACRGATTLVASVDAAAAKGGDLAFSATLHLRGTQTLSLTLAGKQVAATIAGAWPSPSFVGAELPAETTSDGDAFTALWRHDEIGRPRGTTGPTVIDARASDSTVGVDLIEATPVYRMIERTTKYALLLIVLAFTTYVLLELVAGIRMTLLHYALLGASLSLFTLILLSVSELIGYPAGYALSAALVVTQASLYTASVARRVRPTLVFAAVLVGKFGFLYFLLGLETYALVLGAAALFILLSIVMAATQSFVPAAAK